MSKIHEVIPKIMSEVGAISKGRRNQQQNYTFRGIDDAYQAFQPLFAKYGVFVVPTVTDIKREERTNKSGGLLIYTTLTIKHTFFADDGSHFDAVTVGEAMDSGDKSSNKSMSAALKYALLEVFCVPTEGDNDTENHSPEPSPYTQSSTTHQEQNQPPSPSPTKQIAPRAIQSPRNASPVASGHQDVMFDDYKVIHSKEGTLKPWTLYACQFSTDSGSQFEASTFNEEIGKNLDTLKGCEVTISTGPGRKAGTTELLTIGPVDQIP